MTQGIKEKDIQRFKKCVQKLNNIIEQIVAYQPGARIYVTPGEINLMSEFMVGVPTREEQERVVASESCNYMDCDDW